MKKIPTIFKRNADKMQEVVNVPHPDCAWVFNGEGIATRKYDGTCCLVRDGKLYKRREVKAGKPYPDNFERADSDPTTGKTVGWVPVDCDSKEDKWHCEAFSESYPDGTYELIGPKIQGNPENISFHVLIKHSDAQIFSSAPRYFEGLKDWISKRDIEGLVFHHTDGRMAKIKKRDFGLKRNDRQT